MLCYYNSIMSIKKVQDIYIYDISNNKYIDTRFGAGTFILGHTKKFNEQIKNQIDKGTLFGYPSENEEIFRNTLKQNLSWFENFIFCNSGSESIMRAFRIARSFKNKSKIAIISSFWHGGYDGTQIKNNYQNNKIISSSGINDEHVENLILLPNNNIEKCIEILNENKEELAMVFCEPVQQIVPHINQQLLKTLRDFTKKNNILLGFDEMITGFRLSIGGAQEYLNIHADIACYGKIIGGGYPIGVVGFNKEINSHINNVELPIRFGGTFSGNPLSMFAGNLVLNSLIKNKDMYDKINRLTKELCDDINEFCKSYKFQMRFCYVGSFYRIIFTNKKITSMEERDKYELPNQQQKLFFTILKNNGLLVASNPLAFISELHTKSDIEKIKKIYKESIMTFCTQ